MVNRRRMDVYLQLSLEEAARVGRWRDASDIMNTHISSGYCLDAPAEILCGGMRGDDIDALLWQWSSPIFVWREP